MAEPAAPPPSSRSGGPLSGWRVAVTRSSAETGSFAGRLASLGAEVVVVPLIAAAPPGDGGRALAAGVDEAVAGTVTWVVVSSPTGARRLLDELGGRSPAAAVAAVGPGTAEVLIAGGVAVDLVPPRHIGEGLVEAFPAARGPVAGDPAGAGTPGQRVLVVRAAVARDVVPEGLAAKGWHVSVVEAYRTVAPEVSPEAVAALGSANLVTLTSSSTAEALADLAHANPDVVVPAVVCIGPLTAATAEARGLRVLDVASPHSLDGLLDAVVGVVARRDRTGVDGGAANSASSYPVGATGPSAAGGSPAQGAP